MSMFGRKNVSNTKYYIRVILLFSCKRFIMKDDLLTTGYILGKK